MGEEEEEEEEEEKDGIVEKEEEEENGEKIEEEEYKVKKKVKGHEENSVTKSWNILLQGVYMLGKFQDEGANLMQVMILCHSDTLLGTV